MTKNSAKMWFLFASSLGLQSKARYLKALQALLYELKEWLCSYIPFILSL